MTEAEFLVRFPEFTPASSSGLVQAKIDEAAGGLNTDVYGSRLDEAHGYLAAHLLAISPFARNSRMTDESENPVSYWNRYAEIRKAVSPRGFTT